MHSWQFCQLLYCFTGTGKRVDDCMDKVFGGLQGGLLHFGSANGVKEELFWMELARYHADHQCHWSEFPKWVQHHPVLHARYGSCAGSSDTRSGCWWQTIYSEPVRHCEGICFLFSCLSLFISLMFMSLIIPVHTLMFMPVTSAQCCQYHLFPPIPFVSLDCLWVCRFCFCLLQAYSAVNCWN